MDYDSAQNKQLILEEAGDFESRELFESLRFWFLSSPLSYI